MGYKLPKNEYRISITSACNMKCVYCHNEGNNHIANLSIEDIDLLLKNSKGIGLKSVRLTGGEPTIHKDFDKIVRLIHDKYNLKVGVNTNAVDITKMIPLLKEGKIHRVVVGMDYFDGKISKNSPVGVSSAVVKKNILKMKQYCANVALSTVFNNNLEEIDKMVEWALSNDIRIKILEIVSAERAPETRKEYVQMRDFIASKYNLKLKTNKKFFYQYQGYIGDKRVASFFHSLCRLGHHELCKNMHMRIDANGNFVNCIHSQGIRMGFKNGDVKENIKKALKYHYEREC